MSYNQNASYGSFAGHSITRKTAGKCFYVTSAIGTWQSAQFLQDVMTPDTDGVARTYPSITTALAQCVTGRGDVVIIAPDYTTAITDAELSSAGTKGVQVVFANQTETSELLAITPSASLPATTTGAIFTVTGLVELISIIGVVTTVIQTQTCNCKIATVSNSATTDICANLDVTAAAVQDRFSITGTFANAMIKTAKGVPVARQATSLIVQEGNISLITGATNTGAVRWMVRYKPLQPGARIYAA